MKPLLEKAKLTLKTTVISVQNTKCKFYMQGSELKIYNIQINSIALMQFHLKHAIPMFSLITWQQFLTHFFQ